MNPDKPSTSFEGKPSQRTHSNIDLEVEGDKNNQLHHDVPIQDKKTNEHQTTNILDFPDEVLLNILKNVDKSDLKNLRLCCTRLSRLAEDKFLWKLDYRKKPILVSQMLPYETFLEPLTHTLAIRGDFGQNRKNLLGFPFFLKIKQICRVLNTLIIEDFYIAGRQNMPSLATTIEELQIINCRSYRNIHHRDELFSEICNFVPYIKRLTFKTVLCAIDGSLVTVIRNLTELQELRFISCIRIKQFRPFIDISFEYKCQNLKILDFYNTAVEDRLVEWFCHIESLEELYLECPKFLRRQCSYESLLEFKTICSRQRISLSWHDNMLHRLLQLVEELTENRDEEIISFRHNLFRDYFLSKISHYISRCKNLKKLHIRHYWRVTRTKIDRIATTLPNLIELDITGCCVTLEDVKHFESQRPNVQTYSSFSKPHKRYESMSV